MKRAILTIIFLLFCTPLMGAGREVAFPGAKPGIIYVRTAEKRLYFTLPGARAMVYPIAVGKQGRQWTGESFVSFKTLHPTWKPPEMVRKDKPNLPELIGPGPKNPLGVAVLVIGDGRYGIHGTNRPQSIGTEASYGCFRLYNENILELYQIVPIGTPVIVTR